MKAMKEEERGRGERERGKREREREREREISRLDEKRGETRRRGADASFNINS